MSAFDGLGKALRWIRDKQAKKQYQVAETAGVTKAMLSAYETGKQKPSIETLEKILGALQVDLADLFNALQVVNERAPLLRYQDRQAFAPGGELADSHRAGSHFDIYQVLDIAQPMPAPQEEAMTEMLRGFHKFLRHLHQSTAGGVEPPRAVSSEGSER